MTTGAIEAGRAFVRLLVNDTDLQKGLTRAQNKLKLFAASTGQLGRQLMGLSAAIAAPGVAGAKAFMDFERQMAEVSTMLDDPAKFMGAFTDGVKRLAVEFGESTDTLAKGLYDILSASVPPAQAMDVLTASVRAAKAGLSETGVAADAITTILNAYQLSADKAGDVSDWMFGVVKRGKTTFAELAPNIGKVATIAATAGVSLNELGAMLAVLTRNGISTDEAVTSLNAIISTFLKPTDEARQLAQQLGFDLSSTAIQAEGLEGVFRRIASLPPDAIARLFPNVRALKGVLPALRNLEGFADDMALLNNAAGMTEEAYKKLANTLSAHFERVKQAVIIAAVEIGKAFKTDLAGAADKIKELGSLIGKWIQNHEALIRVIGKNAVVIAAFGGGLLALHYAAAAGAIALGTLKTAVVGTGAALTFLAAHPAIAVLAGLTVAVTALGVSAGFAARETFRLAEAQQGLLESGEQKRRQDMDLLNRLQHLSSMQQLSAKQMDEARSIIKRLQATYGDLGITLDETTGKISGMVGAYERTSAKMRQVRKTNLKAAMMEARVNQQFLANQLMELHEKRMDPVSRSLSETDLETKAGEWKARHDALLATYKAEFGADSPDVAGPKGSYEAAIQQDLTAAQNAADFQAKLDNRLHEARLAMIADEEKRELEAIRAKHLAEREEMKKAGYDPARLQGQAGEQQRALEAIRTRHEVEREEAKKTGRDLAKLMEVQAAEEQRALEKIRARHAVEREEAKKTSRDLAKLMEVQAAEVGVIHTEHQRKRDEEDRRAAEDRERKQKDLQEEIEEMEIKVDHKGLGQQLKLLELERKRRIEAAPISGESVANINRLFDLQEQLARDIDLRAVGQRTSVSGTFSAQMAARMGGSSSVEERQLRTQEGLLRVANDAVRELRGMGRCT